MGLLAFLFPKHTSDKPCNPKHLLSDERLKVKFHVPYMPPPTKETLKLVQLVREIEHWQDKDPEIYKRHLEILSDVCLDLADAIESKK